ncbi:MAG: phosphoribosylformylglycinamidine cyclo-ligase [Tissierellia bacterium]|nr:phosphoribosylformylglycinamidine cyclo-ligase [Tissierellia bacterium]
MKKETYKSAGVDKEAGYKEVELIKKFIGKTHTEGVLSGIGGFAGLFQLDTKKYEEPVLVSGTDGVGTKLKLAIMSGIYDTVGEDLVAMCVNDVLCQGAKPLFFLDYIASSNTVPEKMATIVEGIAEGCVKSGCALIGGETAEMPGFYEGDDFDMAGFVVGVVDKKNIIDGSAINEGDILIGLPSSGVHSNGFSLVRKLVFENAKMEFDTHVDSLGGKVGKVLLTPTRIYYKPMFNIIEKVKVNGICHITGGGFFENIPRMMPEGLKASVKKDSFPVPKIFLFLQELGNIDEEEMYSTFNMGIGMVFAISKEDLAETESILKELREDYYIIGDVKKDKEPFELC